MNELELQAYNYWLQNHAASNQQIIEAAFIAGAKYERERAETLFKALEKFLECNGYEKIDQWSE